MTKTLTKAELPPDILALAERAAALPYDARAHVVAWWTAAVEAGEKPRTPRGPRGDAAWLWRRGQPAPSPWQSPLTERSTDS
jgi:hypothetical protein